MVYISALYGCNVTILLQYFDFVEFRSRNPRQGVEVTGNGVINCPFDFRSWLRSVLQDRWIDFLLLMIAVVDYLQHLFRLFVLHSSLSTTIKHDFNVLWKHFHKHCSDKTSFICLNYIANNCVVVLCLLIKDY